MPSTRSPRKGSMQFWHRRRASSPIARIRTWADKKEAKLLGFAGYKVGMTTVMVIDNKPTSMTKGAEIALPATILECPPLKVASIVFYKNHKVLTSVMADKFDKELARSISLPKAAKKNPSDVKEFDDIRIMVYTQPKLTTIGKKKPELFELNIGGKPEDKLKFAIEHLGKEITVENVFKEGQLVDIHAITRGKGYQGPVKRFGVAIRQHKAEKTKRGPASLGDWIHKNMWTVAHAGQMGYHQRMEHNKQVLKIGKDPKDVNTSAGFRAYGVVRGNYVLVKGSVAGAEKRTILFTESIRPNKKIPTQAATITYIRK